MRLIILAWICCILTSGAMASSITLGGRSAFYDSITDSWLCSVPQELFGNDWVTTLSLDDIGQGAQLELDNRSIGPDSLVMFRNITADSRYMLTVVDSSGVSKTMPICFTFLPLLRLQGDFSDKYQFTSIQIAWPNAATQTIAARVKHRGGSTNLPNRNKHNYHLKFINSVDTSKVDRSFFGLRSDNSWILDAGQIDMLRIRNRVATEVWLDMCRQPYYAGCEPKALLGVRGDMVEVFVNNQYNGIYALTEALDRKQLRLAKYETDSTGATIFHGLLWKTRFPTDVSLMRKDHHYSNTDSIWYGLEVKYPDPDDVMPTDFSTLARAIRFVINSDYEQFNAHVGEYFDLPVIMDYWIFINAVLAVDNGAKNIYWAVYDQTVDQRLTLAAWDLDCTMGQNWNNETLHPASVGPNRNLSYFNNLLMRLHEQNPDSFCIKVVERYQQLRHTLLSADSLYCRLESRVNQLKRCGAIARETARWSYDSDLSFNKLDFDAELAYIRQWLDEHLTYLDRTRFRQYICGDVTRDGLVDIGDLNYLINKMLYSTDSPVWYEDLSPNRAYDIADVNQLINILLNR